MPSQEQEHRHGILEAINTLLKRKKFIITNVVVVTAIAVVVSLLLPKKYVSNAVIMPPENADPFSMLATGGSSLLRQFGSISALGVMNEEMYKYVAILESRALRSKLVERFGLAQEYDVKTELAAIELVREEYDYTANEEGTMTLIFEARSPKRARAMAEYTLKALDSINTALALREAKSNREYIEEQIEKNLANLASSEEALKEFQEKHGTVPITPEVSQSADAMAELYSEKMMKEFELEYYSEALGENAPQLDAVERQLAAINRKLRSFPELGMQSFRLLRDYMVQQKIYELIAPLYEHAKILEQKNVPTVIVLDDPILPDQAAYPKKRLIVTVFFVFSLLFSIVLVLLIERIKTMSEESGEQSRLLQDIKSNLKFRSKK